jgi:succinate dehydrogenase / fumarate reductase, cytochrome b subunit
MAVGKRPLSPHLQIYRPQITTVLSISHRFSGAVLSGGFLLLVYWLAALAAGNEAYAAALAFFGAWPVRLMLFLGTLAFYFHLANGLRHLWWDTGRGFEIAQVKASGWAVVVAAGVLTLLTWGALLFGGAS